MVKTPLAPKRPLPIFLFFSHAVGTPDSRLVDFREVKIQLPPPKVPSRCSECKQVLDDPELKFYPGDSNEAVSGGEYKVPRVLLSP